MAVDQRSRDADLTSVTAPMDLEGPAGATGIARRWLGGVHPGYLVLLAVLIVFPLLVSPSELRPYPVLLLTQILIFGIFAMSLDLLLGYVGLPSFGHAAFLGLGGYATAILSAKLGIANIGVSLVAAVVLASIGALILGLLAMRTSGVYFLMLTLAFAQIISAVAQKWTDVTGGTNGLPGVRSPDLIVPGWTVADGRPFYYLALGVTALSFFLMFRLVNSPFGRSLVGIHQNEVRMRAVGYNVRMYKLAVFWVAGIFASVAGVLFAYYNHFISPSDVGFAVSGTAVLMVLIGGEGTLIGSLVGTAVYVVVQSVLSSDPRTSQRWQFVLGLLFVLFVLFVRRGLVGLWSMIRRGKGRSMVQREKAHGAA